MKKLNTKRKIIIFIVAVLSVIALICSAVFVHGLMQKHRIASRKPILKVMSLIPGGFLPSKNIYYIVYDNGDYEETEEFQLADVETYDLYSLKDNKTDLENAPACAKDILEYAETLEHSNIFHLFVINNRYFFDIHDSRSMQNKYTSTVFEYFPESNSVKKLVQFKKYYTQHVELY